MMMSLSTAGLECTLNSDVEQRLCTILPFTIRVIVLGVVLALIGSENPTQIGNYCDRPQAQKERLTTPSLPPFAKTT